MEKLEENFEAVIDRAFDYKESLERQGIKQSDVDLLRERTKRSKFVPKWIHDKQLLLFVNASKDDIDKSSKWIHVYYKMKRNAPEFFQNRDVKSAEIQTALKNQFYLTLPVTPDNCNVVFHALQSYDPKKYVFDSSIKTFIITAEAGTFKNGPRDGTIFLYDMKGGGFRHLFQPSISSVRKGIEFLQAGSPLNVKAIHVFNTNYLIDFIFTMIKPFLKKELYERIHLHSSSADYKEFFLKFVPKSHMPSDYGGDLPSVAELHQQNRQLLEDMRDYFLLEEGQMNLKYDCLAETESDDDDFEDAEDENK